MSQHLFKVQSVIFDMDGVITNTMPYHFRAWKTIFHGQGFNVNYEDVYKREGQPGIESVLELAEELKIPISVEKAKKMLLEKEILFKKIVKSVFVPGARSFLKYLHRQTFQLALVTGTARHEMDQMLPDSLKDLFSVIVTGNDVTKGKPNPEPFLKSLAGLNINPKDAVVIENAPFGIRAAKSAGLQCIALETSLSKDYLKEADFIFKSFKEMLLKVDFQK